MLRYSTSTSPFQNDTLHPCQFSLSALLTAVFLRGEDTQTNKLTCSKPRRLSVCYSEEFCSLSGKNLYCQPSGVTVEADAGKNL